MIEGLAIWVWYWDDRYLDLAKRAGASTLLVKAVDGASPWAQWDDAAAKCVEAGIAPIPWAYNYGPASEVAPLVDAANRAGVRSIVVDPEIEYERMTEHQQRAFVEALKAAKRDRGLTVGCACWAQPQVHRAYRFDLLAEAVDYWLPMVAWQVWEPRTAGHWLDHWDTFGHQPTAPWLPCYGGVTVDELAASVKLALERYGAATLWAAHELGETEATALAELRTEPATVFDHAAAVDALNGVWHYYDQARAAGKAAIAAANEGQARVVALKRAIGLE